MEFDKLFGLPAHPLLVHAPIVLIPLLTLWVLALVLRPDLRDRYATHTAVVGLGLMVLTIMAAGAGEKLQLRVADTSLVQEHADLGDQTKLFMIVFALIVVALALVVRRGMERFARPLIVLAAIAGVVTTVWVVRTGHAGANAVWHDVGKVTPRQEGG